MMTGLASQKHREMLRSPLSSHDEIINDIHKINKWILMEVTCHPRLGGACRRAGGGHWNQIHLLILLMIICYQRKLSKG